MKTLLNYININLDYLICKNYMINIIVISYFNINSIT